MSAETSPLSDRMHPRIDEIDLQAHSAFGRYPGYRSKGLPAIRVHGRFLVSSSHQEQWIASWRKWARLAQGSPGCRQVTLLADPHDPLMVTTESDWEHIHAYIEFERDAEVRGIVSALGSVSFPHEVLLLELVPVNEDVGEEPEDTETARVQEQRGAPPATTIAERLQRVKDAYDAGVYRDDAVPASPKDEELIASTC